MKRLYFVIGESLNSDKTSHFNEESAKQIVSRFWYTDRNGNEHSGEHWSHEECEMFASSLGFPLSDSVSSWDIYVAFNSFYADLNKVLNDNDIVRAAYEFYFVDEDAEPMKLQRYMNLFFGKFSR